MGGAGGLGHLAIQYAKAMGLKVIAMDQGQNKLSFMEEMGADCVFDYTTFDTSLEFVNSVTDNQGVHAAVCAAPDEDAMHNCVHMVKRGGTVVLVAFSPSTSMKVPVNEVITKGITIKGSIVGTRADLKEAMGFAERGVVKPKTHVESMKNYDACLNNLRENKYEGRIVFAEAPDSIN